MLEYISIFVLLLQHPDNRLVEKVVEVIKRFHIRMDQPEPIIGFAGKGISLKVPTRVFRAIQCTEGDENI